MGRKAQPILKQQTDETRNKRISTSIAWIAAGKRRNWKYERV